jgi:(p)ppGpp synthase/HD superfamily hydrolase
MALSARFDEALIYAHELHREQTRKGRDVPFVSHLLGVSSLVLEEDGSEDQAIAALLHDAAEDQGGRATLEEIRSRFGDDVAMIVEACTDSFDDPLPPWRSRKDGYVERLPQQSADALLVSLSDKVYNAGTLALALAEHGPSYLDGLTGGREGRLWYYRALADAYVKIPGFESRLIDVLRRIVEEIESLASRDTAAETSP